MKKADAPAQPTVPTPEISGQEFLRSAYEQGRRDCYDELVGRVVAALGLELVRKEEAQPSYLRAETGASSPASSPAPPPSPRCTTCGHEKSLHEPLAASSCFAGKCGCGGFTLKQGLKLGPFVFGRNA